MGPGPPAPGDGSALSQGAARTLEIAPWGITTRPGDPPWPRPPHAQHLWSQGCARCEDTPCWGGTHTPWPGPTSSRGSCFEAQTFVLDPQQMHGPCRRAAQPVPGRGPHWCWRRPPPVGQHPGCCQPVPIPREVPHSPGLGLPWSRVGAGMGPGCRVLPWRPPREPCPEKPLSKRPGVNGRSHGRTEESEILSVHSSR